MGWIVTMEDVVIMCPLGSVVVLVGHLGTLLLATNTTSNQ